MDVIIGSSTGVVKGVNLIDNTCTNLNFSHTLDKKSENVALCWSKPPDDPTAASDNSRADQTEFLCALLNRQLQLCHRSSKKFENLFVCEGGEGKICGLETLNGNILTCVESGLIKLWSYEGADQKLDISAGSNLTRMRTSPKRPNLIATGGKENSLKIWDVEAQEKSKPVFASKNVRNDWLELQVPIWEADFKFLENDDLIATCTGNHFVRLYDRRTNCRRPMLQIDWLDHPFTSMSLTCHERQVVVGSNRGFMGLFDLRNPGKLMHVYKGFAGSISCVQAHPTLPYVASCGLDRFLRVHHVVNKKMLHKVYCKAHLNTLLLRDDLSISELNGDAIVKLESESASESECESIEVAKNGNDIQKPTVDHPVDDGDVWSQLKTVGDSKKRPVSHVESSEELCSPGVKRRCKSSVVKRKAIDRAPTTTLNENSAEDTPSKILKTKPVDADSTLRKKSKAKIRKIEKRTFRGEIKIECDE